MDADVIGDIVSAGRDNDDVAVRPDSHARSYTYDAVCTGAWKAGNLLRQYGVRAGATVAVAVPDGPDDPEGRSVQPLLAFLGATLLGATVRLDPGRTDAAALVAPAGAVDGTDPGIEAGPGTSVLAYGAVPETPGVAHFEREAWSENPTAPPEEVSPTAVALATEDRSYTHERLLRLAGEVVEEHGLARGDEVVVRAPLSHPGTLIGGVLAPLSVGATVTLDRDRTGTVAVGSGDVPEKRAVRPGSVVG